MEEYEGKTIEGVYACYAVTPESLKILGEISQSIIDAMNDIPTEEKARVTIPNYHMTLEYKGKVADIAAYIASVLAKKQHGNTLDLVKMNAWTSNVDRKNIPHLELEKGIEIPYLLDKPKAMHVSLLEIEDSWNFFRWFTLNLDRLGIIWQEVCEALPIGTALEVDTSKVQIWGKVDGKKKLIVEV